MVFMWSTPRCPAGCSDAGLHEVERDLLGGEHRAHGAEVLPVERRDAQRAQRLAVIDRRVTAVVLPAVAGYFGARPRLRRTRRPLRPIDPRPDPDGLRAPLP